MKKAEILIIDDLSTDSILAIEAGISWALKLNCKPTLINFERSDVLIELNVESLNEDKESYIEEIRKEEKRLISKHRPKLFKDNDSDTEPLFDFSSDIENIVQKSIERKSKLIVVASSNDNSSDDIFIGSTLDKLIRASKVPVLIVKDRSHLNPQKIYMAINMNDVAMDTIEFSSVISDFAENSVVVPVHIASESSYNAIKPKNLTQLAFFEKDQEKRALMQKMDKRLKDLSHNGQFADLNLVNQGKMKISDALISSIKMSESDLVILGKNSDKSFFRAFKESEVATLLNEVHQSILIIKPFK